MTPLRFFRRSASPKLFVVRNAQGIPLFDVYAASGRIARRYGYAHNLYFISHFPHPDPAGSHFIDDIGFYGFDGRFTPPAPRSLP